MNTALLNSILQRLCSLENSTGIVTSGLTLFSDSTGQGLGGTQDGTVVTFTVSAGQYEAGSLIATVGNNTYSAGNGLLETAPSSGQFQFLSAPAAGDLVTVFYNAVDTGIVVNTGAGVHAENTNSTLVGNVDGTNTLFRTARSNYKAGSTLVISGGNVLSQNNGYTESNPGGGEIIFDTAPIVGQVVQIIYQDENASAVATQVDSTLQGLSGTIDGNNLIFAVANGSYQPGSLYVVVGGNYYTAGNGLTESSPGTGAFTLTAAPVTGDLLYAFYQKP